VAAALDILLPDGVVVNPELAMARVDRTMNALIAFAHDCLPAKQVAATERRLRHLGAVARMVLANEIMQRANQAANPVRSRTGSDNDERP